MSQVSPFFMLPDVEERLRDVFIQFLVSIRSKEEAEEFYDIFLTQTEKINLPKKLAILIMLFRGENQRRFISEKIRVSLSTINNLSNKVKKYERLKIADFIHRIIDQDLPQRTYDPDPPLLRGKRVKRTKKIETPYKNLPF